MHYPAGVSRTTGVPCLTSGQASGQPRRMAADRGHHLFGPLVRSSACGADHAVVRVPVEQPERDLVERGLGGADLGEDVDAVAVVVRPSPRSRGSVPRSAAGGRAAGPWSRYSPGWAPESSAYPDATTYLYPLGVFDSVARRECARGDLARPAGLVPDGVGGVVGARARVRDLGDRAGVGAARADRGRCRRLRPAPVGWATGLGPRRRRAPTRRSRSRKSLFQKGASAASALAFQFASTNLVWELGLVLWVLIGWQFTLAEYLGGIVMIVLMTRAAAAVRQPAARGGGPRARQRRRHRPSAPHGRRGALLARAADLGAGRGRTSRTTSAATGRCCGRRSRSASCSPGSSPSSATGSSSTCSSAMRRRRCRRSRT